jgi:hypothetical protein
MASLGSCVIGNRASANLAAYAEPDSVKEQAIVIHLSFDSHLLHDIGLWGHANLSAFVKPGSVKEQAIVIQLSFGSHLLHVIGVRAGAQPVSVCKT